MHTLKLQPRRHLPLIFSANPRRTQTLSMFASSSVKHPGSSRKMNWHPETEADYKEAITLLNQFQLKQSPLHLLKASSERQRLSPRERTTKWLTLLNCNVNHHLQPKVIHVAGSKGKGTTCYYCNHILHEYQRTTGEPKKIGCYTSPHQVDVGERIQINNNKISKWLFSYYFRKLYNKIQSLTLQQELELPPIPGYPGFLALLAIYIFILEKVDVIILETGIGGERDSTNVFPHPVATGITTIGLDHIKTLGNSVKQIAWHKAGIFKPGSPAFCVVQDEAVLKVLRKRAEENQVAGELQVITDQPVLEYGLTVNPDMHYQRLNASLAISLASSYIKSDNPHFTLVPTLARTLQEAVLPGRSQVSVDKDNTWLISVAHSEVSLKETVAWFKGAVQLPEHVTQTPRVLIFNQMFNKSSPRDPYSLLKVIHGGLYADSPIRLDGVVFCTDQSDNTENEKPDLVDLRTDRKVVSSLNNQKHNAEIWKELGGSGNIEVVYTIREAVHLVRENYKRSKVLVTGSSYLASGVLHVLQSSS